MEELKLTYYQINKKNWKKGGKYYKYKTVEDRRKKIPLTSIRKDFVLSFD